MIDWDVNWLAVLVAVVAHQVLGFLWYGPLFGTPWRTGLGMTEEQMQQGQQGVSSAIVVGIIGSVITALSLALLLTAPDDPDVGTGLMYGLLASIGFGAAGTVVGGVFEQRNSTVTWIYAAYAVVGGLVMGAILGGWQ